MKLPTPLAEALNRQIGLELESSLTYLQMAAYFESRSLTGFAHWMRLQSEEERSHALKFFDYVLDRGAEVRLGSVDAPRADFASPAEVFAAALEQERQVSEAIRELHRLASETGDAASFGLLQWFLEEQVEEESTVERILERLEMAGEDQGALLILDRELAGRVSS
ncbi:MAG: ferritin [Acidimicrobiia bacterium]|nr:MAG: ferritin [Acidimicrobiia bacterium]